MKSSLAAAVLLIGSVAPRAHAQLTADQKTADFLQLAGLYAKHYAPYEWKREVIGFDLYNVKPWLDQVRGSKNDLEFYDVCVRYVAALQDSHDEFTLPSDFEAWAHLAVDLYDGKLLIDGIDRSYLPSKSYPFQVGDEIVSIDGKSPQEWITALAPYAVNGSANPVSRQRLAVNLALDRIQSWWPMAVPDSGNVTLVVKPQSGDPVTFQIPWDLYGTPLVSEGPVPGIQANFRPKAIPSLRGVRSAMGRRAWPNDAGEIDNPWGVYAGPPPEPEVVSEPAYMKPLRELQTMEALDTAGSVSPFGSLAPVFNPPSGYKARLGAQRSDLFISGTFPLGDRTVGFIRVPTMSPSSTTTALTQFRNEMAYFQANTDGLVIDVMANGGGSLCYAESLISYLMPGQFRSVAYYIRATQFWVGVFSSNLTSARLGNADQWIIDLYSAYLKEIQLALAQNRGMTGNIPICSPNFENVEPARDAQGNLASYTKPILILTDNFTLSAAEAFGALLQDPGRATIFGMRTDGGGGNPASYTATTYSEGATRVTRTFVTRARPIASPGFPPSVFIENAGVYPDILADYMTQDNLVNHGRTFVAAFSSAIADLIAKSKP